MSTSVFVTLVAALAVAGCGGPSGSAGAGTTTSPGATSSGSSPPSAGPGQFVNPVLTGNFADPFVLPVDGSYYAYATGDFSSSIQVARSTDLATWERLDDGLPSRPAWQPSASGLTWAPEVAHTSAGFVMYYTARDAEAGKQCISVAVASKPEGPFEDRSSKPFICQLPLGGSIDPNPIRDSDGSLYLVWKNDGNCCGMTTEIWLAPLSADGLSLRGKPARLGESNDQTWEGRVVEGPTLVQHDDTWYLFYSANDYASAFYAVGYATSKKLGGPYEDAPENPILKTKDTAVGPGGQTIVAAPDGQLWMLYHAWGIDAIGDDAGGERALWLDRLTFEQGKPVVHGPTPDPQPVP